HTRSKRDWSSDVCSSDLVIFFTISTHIRYGRVATYFDTFFHCKKHSRGKTFAHKCCWYYWNLLFNVFITMVWIDCFLWLLCVYKRGWYRTFSDTNDLERGMRRLFICV